MNPDAAATFASWFWAAAGLMVGLGFGLLFLVLLVIVWAGIVAFLAGLVRR